MKKKEENADNCLYFDISKQERDSAIRYLLNAIIESRQSGGFASNSQGYDEDVNVYMAHLLFAVSLPEYHEMAEPYLSSDTSDILRWVRATEDRTIRYFIFKVNADHLLIHTTVFDDMNGGKRKKIFRRSAKHHQEVAKLYYEQAAAYHKRIYRKKTGVGDVLAKLARNFELYQEVLLNVRREYFHFVNNFKDQAFENFLGEMTSYENKFQRKSKMDQFLDLYGRWLETKNPAMISEITQLAEEIKSLDPEFNFDADDAFFGGGFFDEKKCA